MGVSMSTFTEATFDSEFTVDITVQNNVGEASCGEDLLWDFPAEMEILNAECSVAGLDFCEVDVDGGLISLDANSSATITLTAIVNSGADGHLPL